ncbi:hypothetical protein ACFQHO_48885 [Actinomadura yumaensis]|uniref:hypothetical protein n=1 Tax=Actinomadura yumaensis TaxID=111807 RepID=UPI00361D7BF5
MEGEVDAAVPGIERAGVVAWRRHRSTPSHRDPAEAGCAVLVTRTFDGPDPDRARDLVDALFTAGDKVPPADGLVAAHFYLGLDGAQVLNYALWTSSQAHHDAVAHRPPRLADDSDWQHAHTVPGLRSTTVQRFEPLLLLRP